MSDSDVLVVGTGAMATLFAARLSQVKPVSLLGTWEEGLAALEGQGIRVMEMDGEESRASVRVFREPDQLTGVKFALVLVKSWQTRRAAQDLVRCLAKDGVALTLQNGLGNLEVLQDVLGEKRAILGVTTTGATLLEAGVVRHGGEGPIYLGPHEGSSPFAALLEQAGFDVRHQDDLAGLIWSKLAVNAAINPLTALLEVCNGELLEHESTRALMESVVQEVARLTDVLGICPAVENLTRFALQVAERTSANVSSMLQDIRRGAPTEIEAICGAIVRVANRHHVEAPINWSLWQMVQAKVDLKVGAL